jgi:hypothetical protein
LPISPDEPSTHARTSDHELDLAERFFDIACAQAQREGTTLRLSDDMAALGEVNRRNRASWPPLIPLFDTAYNPVQQGFWVQAVDRRGEIVGAHAARAFLWESTTFAAEAESLRLFYADPRPHLASGDFVEIPAELRTAEITGRTACVGALWVHPDCRSAGLTKLMTRIVKVYACTRWDVSLCWALLNPVHIDSGVLRAAGVVGFYRGLRLRLGPQILPAALSYKDRAGILEEAEEIVRRGTIDSSRAAEATAMPTRRSRA